MSEDRDTDPTVPTEKRSASRRKVLKALGVGGAAVVASRGVPDSWTPPKVLGASVAVQAASLAEMSCSMDVNSDAPTTSPSYVSGYGPHVVSFIGGADNLEFDIEANLGNGSDTASVSAYVNKASDSDGGLDLNLADQTASAGMVSFGPNGYAPNEDDSIGDWLDGFTVRVESDGFENCEIVVSFVQVVGD